MLGNQGDLWMNAQTLFDHDTGSVWSQVTGSAILGPLEGTTLELLPSELSSWSDWRNEFPTTRALAATTSFNTFFIRNLAVAARVNDEVAGLEFKDLARVGSISAIVGGEPIVFVAHPELERWSVFSQVVNGQTLDLQRIEGFVTDPATGDRWDPSTGASFDGNPALDRVPTLSSNFNNFIDIFPDANVLIEPEFIRPIPDPVKSYTIIME